MNLFYFLDSKPKNFNKSLFGYVLSGSIYFLCLIFVFAIEKTLGAIQLTRKEDFKITLRAATLP
jgi:hypothetical protein